MGNENPAAVPNRLAYPFAIAMLSIYMIPSVALLIALWRSGWASTDNFYFSWFINFATAGDQPLNEIHQLLLPLLSGLTVVTMADKSPRATVVLVIGVLAAFCFLVVMQTLLGADKVSKSLAGFYDEPRVSASVQMLGRQREVLAIYLGTLLGVQLKKKDQG